MIVCLRVFFFRFSPSSNHTHTHTLNALFRSITSIYSSCWNELFDCRNFALIVRLRSFDLSRLSQPASHVIIRSHSVVLKRTTQYDTEPKIDLE